MTDQFRDNVQQNRFELDVDGKLATADYRRTDGVLVIDYVEAEPALRGTGAAGRLMEHLVQVAKAERREIVPRCGYAAGWLRRNAG
ncbi:N-acetyltransferase [Phreatobacter aquaticus]|uniref:N-acetyltransferase n=1 Tax=Phreatobacter aquaticus TaxID=2570229 RepID=A0A4D7QLV4_9HYPH|nr:GNAT family N-acetyltransferase [Phreatobacter aquaticus]QCK86097.1 N-acetyltransferase [Phreatobacter aquaticus]